MKIKINLVLILLLALPSFVYAKIQINKISDITTNGFPKFSVTIEATQNGNKISLNENIISIQEMNYANRPLSVVKENDGKYTINWISNLKHKYPSARLFVTFGNEVGAIDINYPNSYDMPQIRTVTPSGTPKVFFNRPPTDTDSMSASIDFQADQLSLNPNGDIMPLSIDSITTMTPYFSYQLKWDYINKYETPPMKIYNNVKSIFVYFKGHENKLYTDKLTIHYNGGQKEELELVANSYFIPTKTLLTITEPKPDDIFTPCFQDTIRWTGALPGFSTYVQFSANGGINWESIGSTLDSFFVWTIPNSITENALLRIYQKHREEPAIVLSDDAGFNKAQYTPTAEYIVASTKNGKLKEWKTEPNSNSVNLLSEDYTTREFNTEFESSINVSISYTLITESEREFATIYSTSLLPDIFRKDTIAFFKSGNTNPIKTIGLNHPVLQSESDPKFRFLAVLPKISNQIDLYSSASKDLENHISFNEPIRCFSFVKGRDSIVIALQSNTVIVFDLLKMQEVSRFDFSYYPLIDNLSLSPDGRFVSFTSIAAERITGYNPNSTQTTQTNIYEFATNRVVRSYYDRQSKALGIDFNPASNKIVRASKMLEHITMYDLSAISSESFNMDGDLTSYHFASEGHNVSSINNKDILQLKRFTYTESEIIDSTFSIRLPVIEIIPIIITDRFIDTQLDTIVTNNFRNGGDLPLLFGSDAHKIRFSNGKNFKLLPIALPDTVTPSENFQFRFVFNPIDTGIIIDTLILETCAQTLYIPVISRGLPRNINFYANPFDFGQICIGNDTIAKIRFIKNLDPVPLRVNFIYFENNQGNSFSISGFNSDTIIAPGADYYIYVRFSPTNRGLNSATCMLRHSKQTYMIPNVNMQGMGLGSDVEISHSTLLFIPEIKKRTITIKNLEDNNILLTGYTIDNKNYYQITTPFPIILIPRKDTEIEIECLSDEPHYAKITLQADPCISQTVISLNVYFAKSNLSIENTDADPRKEAYISINYTNSETAPYNGVRTLLAEISINPTIFITLGEESIRSDYGIGTLLRDEIVNGKRIIGFKVEGNFQNSGTIAEIHGLAGLSNPTISPIEFIQGSQLFGRNVSTDTAPGIFKLINICGDKTVLNQRTQIEIIRISPNPSTDYFVLDIDSQLFGSAVIEIYDNMGVLISSIQHIQMNIGENSIKINSSFLLSGTYRGVLKAGNSISIFTFSVLK